MAHIDNLVASISDPDLRAAVRAEVRKIAGARQFGLVFDQHKPESVLLPKFAIRKGDKVRIMNDATADRANVDDTGVWRVIRITNGIAVLRSKTDAGAVREVGRDRCVVVREFGDPIYPGLRSTGKVERGGDKPWHTVINGENYHALQALLYPYEGRIDAIYLDPPYNTGARDWKYNNDYVDDSDSYRHSKWLSFMEKRLKLARRLLNNECSVLVVTIDEKEIHRLGLLIDQVFAGARTQMVTSVIKPSGSKRENEFSRVEEYLFFVMLGSANPANVAQDMLRNTPSSSAESDADSEGTEGDEESPAASVTWHGLRRRGSTDWRRTSRPGLFYPLFVNLDDGLLQSVGEPIPLGQDRMTVVPPAGTYAAWPLAPDGGEGRWQISPDRFREQLAAGTLALRSASQTIGSASVVYLKSGDLKRIASGQLTITARGADGRVEVASNGSDEAKRPKTVWVMKSHDASAYGTALLSKFVPGHGFPFPKSLYAVEDTLRLFVKDKPDALILDFFSGSGTTAHAVARLNRHDGGRRRSILVTNNEVSAKEAEELRRNDLAPGDRDWEALGIFEHVTVPRITAAFTGRTHHGDPINGIYKFIDESPMSEGFAENAEFFELTYEDPALVSLGRKFSAIAPLLWLKAGARGIRVDEIPSSGWAVPEGGTYGVLFDTELWSDFVEAINQRHDTGDQLAHAFVVTHSQSEFQQIAAKLDSSLPVTRLYADYLRTFEINMSLED